MKVIRQLTPTQVERLMQRDIPFQVLPSGEVEIDVLDEPTTKESITMANIKPTIGRVIWFTPSPAISPGIDHRDQPLQGNIVYVHNDTSINVGGFDARGAPYSAINVKLVQEGESRPEGGHFAEWMPYQKGQAAKTDALGCVA